MHMNPQEYIRKAYAQGVPVKEIAGELGITRDAVKNRARRDDGCPPHGDDNVIMSLESSLTGENPMKEATKAEVDALREHCELHGLPFGHHRLWWHKTKEYSVSFFDKKQVEDQKKEQDEFFRRIRKRVPKYKTELKSGYRMGIPQNADVHIGKLCELVRSGEEYDIDKAIQRVFAAKAELDSYSKPLGLTDITLPLGGDILHVDNNKNTTTSGTHQDTTSSVQTMFNSALEMYIRLIGEYVKKHHVWLIHVSSNHDREMGWALSQAVAQRFWNDPRVHFTDETMANTQMKWQVYGCNLIGYTHGEDKLKDLSAVMNRSVADHMMNEQYRYVYRQHVHHKIAAMLGKQGIFETEKDYADVTVISAQPESALDSTKAEVVRSPSPADNWHSFAGFHNIPAIEMFCHDTERGQIARFTSLY